MGSGSVIPDRTRGVANGQTAPSLPGRADGGQYSNRMNFGQARNEATCPIVQEGGFPIETARRSFLARSRPAWRPEALGQRRQGIEPNAAPSRPPGDVPGTKNEVPQIVPSTM